MERKKRAGTENRQWWVGKGASDQKQLRILKKKKIGTTSTRDISSPLSIIFAHIPNSVISTHDDVVKALDTGNGQGSGQGHGTPTRDPHD